MNAILPDIYFLPTLDAGRSVVHEDQQACLIRMDV